MEKMTGRKREERFGRGCRLRVCDLRTLQNFLWANIVVIAYQTQCRTFIFIVTEYMPTEDQPTKINRQQSFVAKAEHKFSLSYSPYPPGIFIIPPLPIHFHCHKALKPPSCFWKIIISHKDSCRLAFQMPISYLLKSYRHRYRPNIYILW